MKLFRKERFKNGRKHIYFCGIKVKTIGPKSLMCCDIYNYAQLKKQKTTFPHLVGIVISRAATIGNNCTIYQNVTIGSKNYKEGDGKTKSNYPTIGDNSIIYAGAVIVGPVTIGKNCVIGANSVVTSDIPDNSIAVGAPAKVIKTVSCHKKIKTVRK